MGLTALRDMASQLTVDQSIGLMITNEAFNKFRELYLFDHLREKSIGVMFCEYFGVSDRILLLPLSTLFLVDYIQNHYVQ